SVRWIAWSTRSRGRGWGRSAPRTRRPARCSGTTVMRCSCSAGTGHCSSWRPRRFTANDTGEQWGDAMTEGDAQRLDVRLMTALCLAAAAAVVNNASLGPFIPDIARDFESTVPRVGQAATASWFVAALAGIVAGAMAD